MAWHIRLIEIFTYIEIRYYKVQASQLFSVCIAFMCFLAQTKVTCDVNVLVVYGVLYGFS